MFSESDRRIFEYFDGKRTIKADPMAIERRFFAAIPPGDNVDNVFRDAFIKLTDLNEESRAITQSQIIEPAWEKLIVAGRAAFRVAELDEDGVGLTESETIDLIENYFSWRDGLKKKDEPTPNGSEPSDGPQDQPVLMNSSTPST
jgi:hypothetical protein